MTSEPACTIHHILLGVTDLTRSEAFYRDVLGLRRLADDTFPESSLHVCLAAGQGGLVVLVQIDSRQSLATPECVYFVMAPQEWRELEARLTEAGCPVLVDRQGGMRGTGELRIRVADPDGHALDLHAFEPSFYEVPPAGQGRVVAGPIEQFPVGSVTRVASGGFFLVHLQAGFLAISEICTHRQFTITYQPEHYRFYCPLHGNRYSRTGKLTHKGAREETLPLHIYPIELLDGLIVVDTDQSIVRTPAEADVMAGLAPERVVS